jgi:hypothetical protein
MVAVSVGVVHQPHLHYRRSNQSLNEVKTTANNTSNRLYVIGQVNFCDTLYSVKVAAAATWRIKDKKEVLLESYATAMSSAPEQSATVRSQWKDVSAYIPYQTLETG